MDLQCFVFLKKMGQEDAEECCLSETAGKSGNILAEQEGKDGSMGSGIDCNLLILVGLLLVK